MSIIPRAAAIRMRNSTASLVDHLDPLREKHFNPICRSAVIFSAILYYIFGAQLFLQPQLLSHR